MKRVLTAVVLIPLVLIIVFRAPMWLFALLVLVIAVLATLEYLHIVERTSLVPFRRWTLLTVVALFLFTGAKLAVQEQWLLIQAKQQLMGINPQDYPYLYLIERTASIAGSALWAMPLLLLMWAMRRQNLNSSLPGVAASTFAIFFPALPLLTVLLIRSNPFGSLLLLYLLVVVWVGDIFAYYVGSAMGERKLAPRISPGKSWEGAAASLIAASLVGTYIVKNARGLHEFLESIHLATSAFDSQFGFSLRLYAPPWWHGLLLSVGVNIAAQLGDLVESMLKRGAGVKDSGTILPGHGGMLDRIDALLFAAPVVFYYAHFRGVPF